MNLPVAPTEVYVIAWIIIGLAFYGLYNIIIQVVSRVKTWGLKRSSSSTEDTTKPSSKKDSP